MGVSSSKGIWLEISKVGGAGPIGLTSEARFPSRLQLSRSDMTVTLNNARFNNKLSAIRGQVNFNRAPRAPFRLTHRLWLT